MKVEVLNTESFTCRAGGEGGLDGGAFVYDGGGVINSEGSSGRAHRVTSGNSRVYQSDNTPSGGVSGGKMNRVRGEDVAEGGEVVVRRGTNILNTDNVISFQKRLEVGDDFVVTRYQTTRETEATGVDVSGDNGGELEMVSRICSAGIGSGALQVSVLTGVDLHGERS